MYKELNRDEDLLKIASEVGVMRPPKTKLQSYSSTFDVLPFIENKQYGYDRIVQLMSLSMLQNHHANGGPVSRLLEAMVAHLINLPDSRRVIAVSSGTAALHLACGYVSLKSTKQHFKWVTSAFNFFSAKVGPLVDSIVIDCNENGRFDFDRLESLPLDSYDGIIYTNIFAQHSDWKDVADFCKRYDKTFVVDNATGLFDRTTATMDQDSAMEIISAHHTKPWGVGEGGFLICDETDELELRKLVNFGAGLAESFKTAGNNYKISDLSCAAIIDRLEKMPSWMPIYKEQAKRASKLLHSSCDGIIEFKGSTIPVSPRAHTPFLAPTPIDISAVSGNITLRKYYLPLRSDMDTANAQNIYDRIFSVSNAPEMQQITDEQIIAQILPFLQL